MSGIYHLDIQESAEELKQMLLVEKVASIKEKVQALYLLKTGYSQTVSETAKIIGRNRSTVQEWLRLYRTQGIKGLRQQKHSSGRPRAIPKWAEKVLSKQLHQQEGFKDYQEIVEWLQQNCGIEAKYKTVYKLVHYRLQASPKIPRPKSVEQAQAQVEAFKKK